MVSTFRKFLIRARRSGLSVPVLALAAVTIVGLSAGVSGLEGVLFTSAIGLAFLLGTAARDGPFHLRSLATTPLGGPVPKAAFEARIAEDVDAPEAAGQSLCFAIAVDGFDELIGRHGQKASKRILQDLGERLFGEIRNNDCLADLGDGRFAIYLPPNQRIDMESAVQTALRLCASLARPLPLDGLKLHLTASIGFALSGRLVPTTDAPDMLNAALYALEVAERDGPRTVRAFDRSMMRAAAKAKASPSGDLNIVAALKNQQIEPWFQPQICTDTGALTGVEALARWRHPEKGIIAPGAFLDDVRANGLSIQLTETMIRRSVEQICQWDSVGVHIPRVSVNLDIEDLADPTLVDRITWTLDKYHLPPARFGVEILETVIANADPDDMTTRNLLALGAMGCHVDLDDFGTGSASINGIRRFMVNRIKIDRSLVTAVDTDQDQHAMIAAILTMAEQLGVEVLAEGVETPGEHAALAQLGCAHVQGYAIARPMSAPDLLAWVLRRAKSDPPLLPPQNGPFDAKTLRRDAPQRGFDGKTA